MFVRVAQRTTLTNTFRILFDLFGVVGLFGVAVIFLVVDCLGIIIAQTTQTTPHLYIQ